MNSEAAVCRIDARLREAEKIILQILTAHAGTPVSREYLKSKINAGPETRSLDIYVSRLRKATKASIVSVGHAKQGFRGYMLLSEAVG